MTPVDITIGYHRGFCVAIWQSQPRRQRWLVKHLQVPLFTFWTQFYKENQSNFFYSSCEEGLWKITRVHGAISINLEGLNRYVASENHLDSESSGKKAHYRCGCDRADHSRMGNLGLPACLSLCLSHPGIQTDFYGIRFVCPHRLLFRPRSCSVKNDFAKAVCGSLDASQTGSRLPRPHRPAMACSRRDHCDRPRAAACSGSLIRWISAGFSLCFGLVGFPGFDPAGHFGGVPLQEIGPEVALGTRNHICGPVSSSFVYLVNLIIFTGE
jgi:hypothetical protein